MSEIDPASVPSSLSPEDRRAYEREYVQGADLFQRALAEHAKTQDIYKREEFKDVMDKALLVLNETARELKEKKLAEQNAKIEQDYREYQQHPDPETQKKLNQDLERAKLGATK